MFTPARHTWKIRKKNFIYYCFGIILIKFQGSYALKNRTLSFVTP